MKQLLHALGWPQTLGRWCLLVAVLALATSCWMVVALTLAWATDPRLSHLTLWLLWLLWLWQMLPRQRCWCLNRSPRAPYRCAFPTLVVPGATFVFSQLFAPLALSLGAGPTLTGTARLVEVGAGAFGVSLGIGIITYAVRTIGVHRALFLYEFEKSADAAPLLFEGPYLAVRHPLFVGGLVFSAGLAVWSGRAYALQLAAINVLIAPLYSMIEDRRLSRVFGASYLDYRRRVGGLIPLKWTPAPSSRQ